MNRHITAKEKALAIVKAYKNNPGWEEKVKNMSPWQIFAIYDNLVKRDSKYLGPARDEMKKLYMHKIINVLGSDGKAE